MPDPEAERLKRLRRKQLSERDPLVKQRQFQHSSIIKEKRMQKSFSLIKAWREIPHSIRSPFYGLVIGILIVVILPNLWESQYAIYTGAFATILFMIFGFIFGNSLDLRDEIKKNLK